MARPKKWRKVCFLPENSLFGPLGTRDDDVQFIIMPVDQYEAIRLIDWEGLTQEECALQMQVARTTVQRIYSIARKKIADSLVNGKTIKIEGGEYKLCNGTRKLCGREKCLGHKHGHGHGHGRGNRHGQNRF